MIAVGSGDLSSRGWLCGRFWGGCWGSADCGQCVVRADAAAAEDARGRPRGTQAGEVAIGFLGGGFGSGEAGAGGWGAAGLQRHGRGLNKRAARDERQDRGIGRDERNGSRAGDAAASTPTLGGCGMSIARGLRFNHGLGGGECRRDRRAATRHQRVRGGCRCGGHEVVGEVAAAASGLKFADGSSHVPPLGDHESGWPSNLPRCGGERASETQRATDWAATRVKRDLNVEVRGGRGKGWAGRGKKSGR